MTVAMVAAPRPGLSLDELACVLAPVGAKLLGDGALRVVDVSQDSRNVAPGFAFLARSGGSAHGLQHAPAALAAGASAVISGDEQGARQLGVPVIVVENERKALALAAEALHGYPSRDVKVVAVTGTNGKTTVAVLGEYLLGACGARAARLGTLGFSFAGELQPSNLTTPEADQISRWLAQVRARGATHCILEASSHALSQFRLDGLTLDVGAFTNLTQDHLDYHGDLLTYSQAKARLFEELRPRASVIHCKDELGWRLAAAIPGALKVGDDPSCPLRPLQVRCDQTGIHGTLQLPYGTAIIKSPLIGRHNLENLLVVLGIVSVLGLDTRLAAESLSHAPMVPGRLERCDAPGDLVTVLVDYAHTPDALARVLSAVRQACTGKLICVFGCGGDRDPGKRPLMGEIAGKQADRVIVTNDNPRTEDPELIADAVIAGLADTGTPYERILDREQAIGRAIELAGEGDCVLLAGKGHEDYQIIGSERRAFDDREVARAVLRRRRAAEDGG